MRFLLLLAVVLPVLAQQPAQPPSGEAPRGNRTPPAPRNLKLLQPNEVRPMMGAFRTALGVQCNHCHVQGDFASDDNPKKEVARNMIVMMREINGKFPDGKLHVSCYTCHRGAVTPATGPDAQASSGAAQGQPAGQTGTAPHQQ